ncbi:hypothetical protein [Lacticaseibacillus daqingensis]|uniref:hypothetical protein n=1 Tax=Lacticaseibacillus daqingensis TaxID=2486014 RepID=UPI000F7B191A|nr:hypothetical protein [Lacticaseibacillus daqingensis]
MPLFQSNTTKTFQAQVRQLFTPADLYFIYCANLSALETCYRQYIQAFMANGARKSLGLITPTDTGVVPYLSVRNNLLINGRTKDLALIPDAFRRDLLQADVPATALTVTQTLYLQLFRGVVAGREFLLMHDFPARMTLQERRDFLNVAATSVRARGTSLILLTQDENLITAHPATSWTTAPQLSDATA